jgi:predicted GNAT family N-acyltransferase
MGVARVYETRYRGELMSKALLEAKDRQLEVVRIESDPNAESFYKKFGAIRIGFANATPKPRKLPILEISIK